MVELVVVVGNNFVVEALVDTQSALVAVEEEAEVDMFLKLLTGVVDTVLMLAMVEGSVADMGLEI